MATVLALGTLPDGGGVFTAANLAAIAAALANQDTNNAALNAGLATVAALGLTGADTLTAHAGGTQAAALALTSNVNKVTVSGTIGDSVKLGASAAGALNMVINDAAKAIQVFGAGTDTIDDVATATGIQLPGKAVGLFFAAAAGKWYSFIHNFLGLQSITANGAINPNIEANYVITKAGIAAMTLAAPTATVDDGKILRIVSSTDFAHTVTATGLFQDGAATTDLATFAVHGGASITMMAFNAKWIVVSQNQITFS